MLFMGIPFDRENFGEFAATLKDITPARPDPGQFTDAGSRRPRKQREAKVLWGGDEGSDVVAPKAAPDEPPELSPIAPQETEQTDGEFDDSNDGPEIVIFSFVDEAGEIYENADAEVLAALYREKLETAELIDTREALWENGEEFRANLRAYDRRDIADDLDKRYAALQVLYAEEPDEPEPATDLLIPYNAAEPGKWFQPAGAKLREMMAQNRPPADFTKFRDVNKSTLDILRGGYSFWSSELEKRIVAGEQKK